MQPSSRIKLHLFGGLTVFPDGAPDQPLSIPSRKACALLAYLATQREARREQLAKLLWGDRFDKQARQSLRQSLLALRKQLEPVTPGLLVLEGEVVALDAALFTTDAREFAALAEQGGDPERALALYRGEFLAGFSLDVEPFDAWVTEERARLAAIAALLLQAPAAPKPTAVPIEATNRASTTEARRPGSKNPISLAPRDANGADAAPAPSAPERGAEAPLEAEGRFEPSAASGWRWQIANPWLLALACVVVLAITASRVLLLAPSRSVSALPDHQAPSVIASAAQRIGHTFKDCDICPEMIELPVGEFMMGSPQKERGRETTEGPQRRVVIAKRFALGRFEVTVDQLAAFVAETGVGVGGACHALDPHTGRLAPPDRSFHQPGFEFTGSHPAVCVSWHEAQAYVAWLGRRTGRAYRLPSEAEWEYTARGGTTTRYSFGDEETELCHYARFPDLASSFASRGACRGPTTTHGPLPVGALKPNPWGLFDMHGNVWEWVADCWTPDALEMPVDGSAFKRPGHCVVGVIRGGGWTSPHARLRSAMRLPWMKTLHYQAIGLRVALSLEQP
jgi:formylglycine-generating enzyme required for sulfatase activity